MTQDPVISIGMPVYNGETTVLQAIRSVQKQSFTSWELIVLDDGSTDGTSDLVASVRDPRIRLVSDSTNRKLPFRLNECVRMARGRYFARMDGDDVCFPSRLQQQLAYLQSHPEVDLLGGAVLIFRSNGSISSVPEPIVDHHAICGPPWARFRLVHPTWFAKTEWFRKYPYDEEMSCTQDRALLLQTHRETRYAAVPELVLAYRQDDFPLRKSLPMRRQYARALWRDGIRHRSPAAALAAITLEACKASMDVVSSCVGLNHRYARGTRKLVAPELHAEWKKLWCEVNATQPKCRITISDRESQFQRSTSEHKNAHRWV